jgi:hypothetical protein
MTISGIGSSSASPFPHESLPADASVAEPTVAQPDGTAGLFSTGMSFLVPTAGDTIDAGAARLTLLLLQADKANDRAIGIKAALAPIFTLLGGISGSATRRAELAAANARLDLEIAGLDHQLDQKTVDLAVAQDALAVARAELEAAKHLDPPNEELVAKKEDLVAEKEANVATINADIAVLSQSKAQRKAESDSNTTEIASLQSTFLVGFTLIARFIVQRISDEQQTEVARSQTVIETVQEIYDDLRNFLDDTQVAEILRLVQQQQADDADVATREVAAGATGQATDARQIQNTAGAQPPLNNLAIPGEVSPTGPDQAPTLSLVTASNVVPTTDAPRPLQIATPLPAPAGDPGGQDDERERDINAAEQASRQQQDQATRTAIAVEPPPRQDLSQEEPSREVTQDPAAAISASAANQRAPLQTTIASDTLERGTSDRISDARASDMRVQHSDLITDVTRRADELAARLERIVQRFVKSDAPLGDSLTVASLQNQENPGRWRLQV